MATGNGGNSYAANSRLPKKALIKTRPVLEKATVELYNSLSPGDETTMVFADLGCSSGPNTLLVVSEVMSTLRACTLQEIAPCNDFNLVFRSLEQQLPSFVPEENKDESVGLSCYVAGLPGSFYTRLFPNHSVHLFHSSCSLMWRSKVPGDLSNGSHQNEENIYIGKTTTPTVVALFKEQFQKDFKLFLTLRYKELVSGGRMGRVEKAKLMSFNLPYYAPSVNEVNELIMEDHHFSIDDINVFESNWDPYDDSDSDVVLDCASSGKNVANKSIRAVMEPLIVEHFGEAILDELFMVFASMVSKHLEIMKAKYPVIVVSLKKTMH
nr:unnamed protein product [Digitaria exilis]